MAHPSRRLIRLEMQDNKRMIRADKNDSLTTIVLLVLAVVLVAWGWMRSHASVETVPVTGGDLESPMIPIQ